MKRTMILIHGTWGTGEDWQDIKGDFEALGYDVLAPSLPFHDLPYEEVEEKIGNVSLKAYADYIVQMVNECDTPPILVGHSLGCLVAQIAAQYTQLAGMILLGPAPTSDIDAFYPTMVKAFLPHFLRWGFWKKPIPPYERAINYAHDQHDSVFAREAFKRSVSDSGKAYTQLALPMLDRNQTTTINFGAITCPIFILVGLYDKLTVPAIAQETATNYGNQATVILSGEADHTLISRKFKSQTIYLVKR